MNEHVFRLIGQEDFPDLKAEVRHLMLDVEFSRIMAKPYEPVTRKSNERIATECIVYTLKFQKKSLRLEIIQWFLNRG